MNKHSVILVSLIIGLFLLLGFGCSSKMKSPEVSMVTPTESDKGVTEVNNIDMNDLVVYYNFDEGGGSVVLDQSPRGNHGIIIGSTNWEEGKYGMALRFNVGSYINLNGPKFKDKPEEGITICVWVNHQRQMDNKKTFTDVDNQGIFNVIGTAHSDGLYHAEIRHDNTFRWFSRDNDNTPIFDIDDKGIVPPNQWVHFAGTYSNIEGKAILYVNGEKVAESSSQTRNEGNLPLPKNWRTAHIGQYKGDRWYVGLMDDFLMWRRVLTQEEIKMIMDGKQ